MKNGDNLWELLLSELQRLNESFEKQSQKLEEIKESTVENTGSLKAHMYRTQLNEEHIKLIEDEFKKRIVPVEDHIKFVTKSMKILMTLLGLPGGIYYCLQVVKLLKTGF